MNHDPSPPTPAVFVVDDDAAIQNSLQGLLSAWGVPVRSFLAAEPFLEAFRPDWTGCLLADHRMTGMGGVELLKELRLRGSALTAVLMTGHGDAELQQQALDNGAVHFLEKPFRVPQFREFLARQCPELFAPGPAREHA